VIAAFASDLESHRERSGPCAYQRLSGLARSPRWA